MLWMFYQWELGDAPPIPAPPNVCHVVIIQSESNIISAPRKSSPTAYESGSPLFIVAAPRITPC